MICLDLVQGLREPSGEVEVSLIEEYFLEEVAEAGNLHWVGEL
jgi:hypothetical protein